MPSEVVWPLACETWMGGLCVLMGGQLVDGLHFIPFPLEKETLNLLALV